MHVRVPEENKAHIEKMLGVNPEDEIPLENDLHFVSGSSTVFDHNQVYKTKYPGITYIHDARQTLYGADVRYYIKSSMLNPYLWLFLRRSLI